MAFVGSSKKEFNTFTVRHIDNLGSSTNSERFNFALKVNDIDSDTAIALDTFARAMTALTTDTYNDSEIVTARNLETIAGG